MNYYDYDYYDDECARMMDNIIFLRILPLLPFVGVETFLFTTSHPHLIHGHGTFYHSSIVYIHSKDFLCTIWHWL